MQYLPMCYFPYTTTPPSPCTTFYILSVWKEPLTSWPDVKLPPQTNKHITYTLPPGATFLILPPLPALVLLSTYYIHPPPRCYFPYTTTPPSPCNTFYILQQGCKSGLVKKSETLQLMLKLHHSTWMCKYMLGVVACAWRVKSGAGSQ